MAAIFGWFIGVPPGVLCLSFGLINFPLYSMEINFIMTGKLTVTATDDLGPVEIELLLSTINLVAAILGPSCM